MPIRSLQDAMEEIARQDNALKVIEQLAEAWSKSTVYDVQKAFQNIAAVAKSAQPLRAVDGGEVLPLHNHIYVDGYCACGHAVERHRH